MDPWIGAIDHLGGVLATPYYNLEPACHADIWVVGYLSPRPQDLERLSSPTSNSPPSDCRTNSCLAIVNYIAR